MNEAGETKPGALDIPSIAQRYSISRRTIRRWMTRGLPYFQEGPRCKILIKPDDVERYLQRHCHEPMDLGRMIEETVNALNTKRKEKRNRSVS
jgi:hypothetical protein